MVEKGAILRKNSFGGESREFYLVILFDILMRQSGKDKLQVWNLKERSELRLQIRKNKTHCTK
jgi:hypothetical protein